MGSDGIKKLYYSIGEVCALTDLEPHVLRYWEGEFDRLQPRKNRSGRRIYTEDDLVVVRRIQHLLKEEKYTLEGARQVLAREGLEPPTDAARRELLALRGFLEKLLQRL